MRYSAAVRPTTRNLVVSLALALGCRREEPIDDRGSPTQEREEVPVATERDLPAPDGAIYSRSLIAQLDLIPPDADGYLVIRDLRPLLAQAQRVEQVLAGPLARAIPALAKMGGGTGEGRLEQIEQARAALELLLAGVEAAGVELDRGLVVAFGAGAPLIVFAADDLGRLGMLASLVDGVDLTKMCGQLTERPGWFACSLGDPEALSRYVPAEQGRALAERLADRVGVQSVEELEPVNVALSMVEDKRPFDAILRTDPGLWELTLPLPADSGEQLLRTGPAPALRALVPGTSFAWARVDAAALDKAVSTLEPLSPGPVTGEVWFGAVDEPDGLVAQMGITDVTAATAGIEALAKLLPDEPIEPEELEGLKLDLDRASIQLDGQRVQTIGVDASGEGAAAWVESLGVEARGRLWAHGKYVSVALGEVQAIPGALAKLEGEGPSAGAIATLPASVGRALIAGEVGLLVHLVLDHWQAPPSEAELEVLLAGLPEENRPSAIAITSSFQALAPWSSVDLWLSRSQREEAPWLLNLSVVPFAAEGGGVTAAEATAAAAVLDAVLAGSDGVAGYRELLTAYPRSPRVTSYRARAGDAPEHHAAASMVMIGAIGAIAIPALSEYMSRAKSSEAPAQTQSMLSAALAVREQKGCEALIGETKLTPPRSVKCSEGEGARCRASEGPKFSAGEYPLSAWTDDPLWAAIGSRPRAGHRFHYRFRGEKLGEKGCRLTVTAMGDIDGDDEFSTYERQATIDDAGAQTLIPMTIENPDE